MTVFIVVGFVIGWSVLLWVITTPKKAKKVAKLPSAMSTDWLNSEHGTPPSARRRE